MTERGKFIVIEGTDGSGSTTQTALLVQHLRDHGKKVLSTKEPTAGPAGALIRMALDRRLVGANRSSHDGGANPGTQSEFDARALALLFAADRVDHSYGQIQPALERGWWVVCDRYVLSSLAYQGPECGMEWVLEINRFALAPDLTVFLDVPVETTQQRMQKSRIAAERYESTREQHTIRDGYQLAIARYRERYGRVLPIDAVSSAGVVSGRVVACLADFGTIASTQ
jgi:dTMP kinase